MTRGILVCLAALFALPLRRGRRRFVGLHAARRSTPPTVRDLTRAVNPIDAFVFTKLEAHKLTLSARPIAPPCSGALPRPDRPCCPTIAEQDAFLSDGLARRLSQSRGSLAGIAALRRALGTALA